MAEAVGGEAGVRGGDATRHSAGPGDGGDPPEPSRQPPAEHDGEAQGQEGEAAEDLEDPRQPLLERRTASATRNAAVLSALPGAEAQAWTVALRAMPSTAI